MRALLILYLVDQGGDLSLESVVRQPALWLVHRTGLVHADPRWLPGRSVPGHPQIAGDWCESSSHWGTSRWRSRATLVFSRPDFDRLGTGFFKSNVIDHGWELYREDDPRRDPGYTFFYMGINLGAFVGPAYLRLPGRRSPVWLELAFAAAGVGMVLGLIVYLAFRRRFRVILGLSRPGRNGWATPSPRTNRLRRRSGTASSPSSSCVLRDLLLAGFRAGGLVTQSVCTRADQSIRQRHVGRVVAGRRGAHGLVPVGLAILRYHSFAALRHPLGLRLGDRQPSTVRPRWRSVCCCSASGSPSLSGCPT